MMSRLIRRSICALTVVLMLALLPSNGVASQTTNLERLTTGVETVGDSLLMSMQGLESNEICIRVVEHPADWLVEQGLIRRAEAAGMTVVPCRPPLPNDILVAVTDIGVRYVELEDGDYVRREIKVGLSASLPRPSETGRRVERVTETRQIVLSDTIETDQAVFLENPAYDFTVGAKVVRNKSDFWGKVVEPAVVVGATIVMVVLLFTTRSQ